MQSQRLQEADGESKTINGGMIRMNEFWEGMISGLIIGVFLFGIGIGTYVSDVMYDNISELGQSICDQEYDMDYDNYYDSELTCKPKEIKEEVQYDGIIIQIKEV